MGDEAVGVGQGKAVGNNLGRAPLPLSRGSSDGSLLSGVGLGKGSLGGSDLLSISDLDSLEDRSRSLDSIEDGGSKASNGKVGARDTESVDVMGNVVDSLDQAVGVQAPAPVFTGV